MTYVIAEPCIGIKDRSCVDECPVDCIYEGEEQLFIHPEECVDCDACLPACPVDAIFTADTVPPGPNTRLRTRSGSSIILMHRVERWRVPLRPPRSAAVSNSNLDLEFSGRFQDPS